MTTHAELKAARHAKMTDEQRAVYNEAYMKAGVAMRVAELFYNARSAAGITQTELAHRMGTSQPTIAEIEGGGRVPTLEMLERLANATGKQLEIALIA